MRTPLKPGRGVEAAHEAIRKRIPHREADYLFQDELRAISELVHGTELLDAVANSGVSLN